MPRVADRLIEQLRDEIRSGALQPGDQLEEATLAARFGVSRTPVREAVRSLVDSGLLETRSRKGAFVRELSAKELIDLFEVAAELEGMACRLAAERLTDAAAAAIETGLAACKAAVERDDLEDYVDANLLFHRAVHRASGNLRLSEQIDLMSGQINPYRSLPYRLRGRMAASMNEHCEILAAILAGDGAKADALMRDHITLQGQRLPIILRTRDDR